MSRKLEIELELRIVRKCAEDAIAMGYFVSVNDGEETTVKRSKDIDVIMAACLSTDEDYLIFHAKENGEFKKLGWARFIYGNVQDVLSDYSANDITGQIVSGANTLAAQYD